MENGDILTRGENTFGIPQIERTYLILKPDQTYHQINFLLNRENLYFPSIYSVNDIREYPHLVIRQLATALSEPFWVRAMVIYLQSAFLQNSRLLPDHF